MVSSIAQQVPKTVSKTYERRLCFCGYKLARATELDFGTSCVTGRPSNQLARAHLANKKGVARIATPDD